MAFLALAAVVVIGVGCGGDDSSDSGGGGGSESLSFAVSAPTPEPSLSYFTSVPEALGYFEDEGLDIDFGFFNGDTEAAQAVVTGKFNAALSSTATLAQLTEGGRDPYAFWTDAADNVYAPAAPVDSGIESIADYAGKTVGLQSLGASSYNFIKGIMALEGVDPEEVNFVPVGEGAPVATQIDRGKIDTYQAYIGAYLALAPFGVEMDLVPSEVSESIGYTTALYTNKPELEENTEAFVALGRAFSQGWLFSKTNPEAAVKIHWEEFPESKPTGVSEDDAVKSAVEQLESRLDLSAVNAEGLLGESTPDQIEAALEVYKAGGLIKQEPSPDEVYTSEYIGEINDFDREAVEKEANQYTP